MQDEKYNIEEFKSMMKDMCTVESFIKTKGKFSGELFIIPIKDFAKLIRDRTGRK